MAKSELIFYFRCFQVLKYVKTALGAQKPFRKFKKVEGEEDNFRGEEDDFRGDEDEDLFTMKTILGIRKFADEKL